MLTKNLLIIILLTQFAVTPSENGRILAIMPTPSYSHQIVFNPLWLSLHARGHHITLFTTDPIKSNLSNFRQVDWSYAYQLWHEKYNISDIINNFNTNLLKCLNQYVDMMSDIIIQELEHPQVKEIMNNKDEHFDLVIVEFLNPVMIGFSKRFNCPFIGVSPMDLTNFVHEGLNNPVSPALFTDFISRFDSEMSFLERVINTFYYLGGKMYFMFYFYPKMDTIMRNYFGENTPKLEEMQRTASMVFLNINPIIHNTRPLMNNILLIGGGTHVENEGSLSTELKEFLDDAKTGVIYFSLGTNVKSKDMSDKTKSVLLETFTELPYKVLWKFEETISTNPNILVKKWLPQQQILRHPKVVLFITQGGLQSLEEAIYYEVPVIAMPVYVDQYSNVRRVIRQGLGLKLDYYNVEKATLKSAINETVNNPKFKRAASKLSAILKDQPISGITQAVWWTEYVMKYKGAKFLKSSEIPLYQYLLLDVVVFFLLLTGFGIFLFIVILKCFINVIKKRGRGKKNKIE